jgi:hypothetical protein
MTFKPAIWKPITFVLSAANLVAVGLAAGAAEPYHAAGHAALALGFGLWAQRLWRSPTTSIESPVRLQELDADMSDLRRELSEVQERLDFTERVLAQRPESRQVGPER